MRLKLTHPSLYYLAGYVVPAGLMLLFAPQLALKLMLSNTTYDSEALRPAGIALTSLGIFVVQMIRLKLEALYPTTLVVRVFILSGLGYLYASSNNPFFLVLIGIVGLGLILTTAAYIVDRRRAP